MRFLTRIAVMILLLALLFPFAAPAADEMGAPSDLKLAIEGKGFMLTWKASPDDPGTVTKYEIARAISASGPFETIGKVGKGVTRYYDEKAAPENIYYYKVRAVCGWFSKQYSAYSNTVTGELPGM